MTESKTRYVLTENIRFNPNPSVYNSVRVQTGWQRLCGSCQAINLNSALFVNAPRHCDAIRGKSLVTNLVIT